MRKKKLQSLSLPTTLLRAEAIYNITKPPTIPETQSFTHNHTYTTAMLRDDFVYHNEDVRMDDDEEDEDEAVLPMASSRIVMTTEDSATYQPKCSFLSCVTSTNFSSGGSQAAAARQ